MHVHTHTHACMWEAGHKGLARDFRWAVDPQSLCSGGPEVPHLVERTVWHLAKSRAITAAELRGPLLRPGFQLLICFDNSTV